MVIRSVRLATGAEAATRRSAVGEAMVMNTAALAVPPTVSRAQTSPTSGPDGCAQAARGAARISARASFTAVLLRSGRAGLYPAFDREQTGPRCGACALRWQL